MASTLVWPILGGVALSVVLGAMPMNAQDGLTLRKIDPATRIEDLSKGKNTCYIVIRNGKAVEICNLIVPEIEDLLKKIEEAG